MVNTYKIFWPVTLMAFPRSQYVMFEFFHFFLSLSLVTVFQQQCFTCSHLPIFPARLHVHIICMDCISCRPTYTYLHKQDGCLRIYLITLINTSATAASQVGH